MKVKLHDLFIPLIYFGLFFLTNYFSGGINYLDLIFFTTGIVLGVVLMYLDEAVLYQYYSESSVKTNLITRSLLFAISLLPLGLFIVTSTGSELGVGLFLGIVTTLLFDLIRYRQDINFFHLRFLFQLKRRLSAKEINIYVAVFSILTVIFIWLAFF